MRSTANDILKISIRKLSKVNDRRLSGGMSVSFVLLLLLFIAPRAEDLLIIGVDVFFFGILFLAPYLRALIAYNRIVDTIEADASEISFGTVGYAAIGGWLKFKPQWFCMPASQLTLIPNRNRYIVLNFSSAVYSFRWQRRKYYIIKACFDDFDALERALGIAK